MHTRPRPPGPPQVPRLNEHYRARLEAARSVDDTVAALVSSLACRGLLDDTVIIYTSDNGFKLGNHNIAQEKFTQYEVCLCVRSCSPEKG